MLIRWEVLPQVNAISVLLLNLEIKVPIINYRTLGVYHIAIVYNDITGTLILLWQN